MKAEVIKENHERSLYLVKTPRPIKHKGFLDVKKWENQRTLDQNRYYWKFCTYVGIKTFHTKDEIHQAIKGEFREKYLFEQKKEAEKEVLGKKIKVELSTRGLNKKLFGQFIEDCFAYVSEFGVDLSEFFEQHERWKNRKSYNKLVKPF